MTLGEGALYFAAAWLTGAALGVFYGFLTPLGKRCLWLADGLFCLGAAQGWLWVGFGLCGGDLRPAWLVAMGLGAICWAAGPGRLLAPVWQAFWGVIWKILGFLPGLAKKFGFFQNYTFHLRKNRLQ